MPTRTLPEAFSRLTHLVRGSLGFEEGVAPLCPDEGEVWSLARLHQVAPVLAPEILKSRVGGRLEDEARHYRQLGVTREKIYREALDEVVLGLSAAGVRPRPLKGLVLAACYPVPGMRTFRDLDLLIRREDLRVSDGVLRDMGFKPMIARSSLPGSPQMAGDPLEAAEASLGEAAYERQGLCVEMHTRLLPALLGDFPPDAEAGELSAHDTIAHLMFHAVRHHFPAGLRHMCDTALWAVRARPSFEKLFLRLRETGTFDLAYPSWALSSDIFPEAVPEPPRCSSLSMRLYCRNVRRLLADMPTHAVNLAGSPLLFAISRRRVLRAVFGSKARASYERGTTIGRTGFVLWRMRRPFDLFKRHALVLAAWTRFLLKRSREASLPRRH